jgi:ferrous iron transport protein B
MPDYRIPSIKGIFLIVWIKVGEFVKEAGKIILAVSILIWVLANNSPITNKVEVLEKTKKENPSLTNEAIESKSNSVYLEKSYLGILGKTIEPLIEPLGYDWKIGIGIISSLIAREVFVGTMASIYSIGSDNDSNNTLKQKMLNEKNPNTGKPIYNLASGWSLLLFYAFSMQCISTLAVVKRETKSWRWPLIQFSFMTTIAYFSSLLIYTILKS